MTMRTNYFLLLAILLGVIPMNYTHANDSIPKKRDSVHTLHKNLRIARSVN